VCQCALSVGRECSKRSRGSVISFFHGIPLTLCMITMRPAGDIFSGEGKSRGKKQTPRIHTPRIGACWVLVYAGFPLLRSAYVHIFRA
jgi:hypothetical protein